MFNELTWKSEHIAENLSWCPPLIFIVWPINLIFDLHVIKVCCKRFHIKLHNFRIECCNLILSHFCCCKYISIRLQSRNAWFKNRDSWFVSVILKVYFFNHPHTDYCEILDEIINVLFWFTNYFWRLFISILALSYYKWKHIITMRFKHISLHFKLINVVNTIWFPIL